LLKSQLSHHKSHRTPNFSCSKLVKSLSFIASPWCITSLHRQDRVTAPPHRAVVVVVVLWAERGVQHLRQGLQVAAGLATNSWRPSELLGVGG